MQPKESAAFAYHFKRHALHRLSFGVRCQGTMPAVLTKTNLFCAAVYMEYFTQHTDSELNDTENLSNRYAVRCWSDLRRYKRTKENAHSYKRIKNMLRETANFAQTYWEDCRAEQERRLAV